ncbi:hypothetical protein C8R47DRAFT_1232444 [Mycena vitilis]|nr:hypothetical protein C8R47DRAFT_1232444 [Mycena vitilis]
MADLKSFREELQHNPFYLGGSALTEKVQWKRVGREDMVVSANAAAVEGAAADSNDEGDQPDPVALSIVATVSPEDFWLVPCGFWKGPTIYTPTFADLKLNCRLVAAEDPLFAADFRTGMKNVEKLTANIATEGHSKVGLFDTKEKPKTTLKLRHVVFEEKEAGDEDDPNAFQVQDWPAKSTAAQEALDGMITTHRVNPIAAYDINGDLIAPSQYSSALMGAVVRANFTLSHWNIAKDKRDSYSADIDSLRVVVPPKKGNAGGSSPARKRKGPPAATDLGASPLKKSRSS